MTINWLPRMFQQQQTTQTGFYLLNGAMTGFVSEGVRISEVLGQKLNFSVDATCHGYYIQLFERFFPKQLLQNVIDIVNEKMDGDKEVVYGEFIWCIGIWVLMSTVDGVDWHSFW